MDTADDNELDAFWDIAREHADLSGVPVFFDEIVAPAFAMTAEWEMAQLLGYLASWSATARYVAAHGKNPVREFAEVLGSAWGDPEVPRAISWPLTLRAGRV